MDADLVENLNDWKCGPRVVGGGDQTVVDGCGDLAVGCHRKSTSKVTFKVKLMTPSPIVQGLLVVPEDSRVKLSRLMERKTLRASSA